MKTTKKIELPILKDIVVPGKDMPEVDELPSVLSDIQIRALEQQIERIVQFKLEAVLKHATKEAVKEINAHLVIRIICRSGFEANDEHNKGQLLKHLRHPLAAY